MSNIKFLKSLWSRNAMNRQNDGKNFENAEFCYKQYRMITEHIHLVEEISVVLHAP